MRKILVLTLLVLMGACSTPKSSNQDDFAWQLTIEETQIVSVLTDKVTITHYDGTSEEVTLTDQAESGKVFVLIHLTIVKAKSGGSAFSWDKLSLVDASDNSYPRLQDDFLTRHELTRLPLIDLRLGTNTGWIAFEVDQNDAKKALKLRYQADEGDNTLWIEK